jgi:hypothetical protein
MDQSLRRSRPRPENYLESGPELDDRGAPSPAHQDEVLDYQVDYEPLPNDWCHAR